MIRKLGENCNQTSVEDCLTECPELACSVRDLRLAVQETDIEDVAENTPEAIHKIHVDPSSGLLGFQKRNLGVAIGLSGSALKSFFKMIGKLYEKKVKF